MGCNCKNKSDMTTKKQKIVPQTDGSVSIYSAPEFTWEEVIAVEDYLGAHTKTEEGRMKMVNFNEKYFGEKIMGYCDQPCMTRVKQRIALCKQQLNEWEQKKNK